MKGNDGLGCIVLLIIVAAVVVLVGGPLVGSAAEGFARGGGNLEARAFTTETYSHAEAGDNSVALAITGDQNGVNLAYAQAQPTPQPDRAAENAREARETRFLGGFVLAVLALAIVAVFLVKMLDTRDAY